MYFGIKEQISGLGVRFGLCVAAQNIPRYKLTGLAQVIPRVKWPRRNYTRGGVGMGVFLEPPHRFRHLFIL